MKIKLISVGKTKEKFHKEAIEELQKRLSGFCNLEIIEIQAENIFDENLYEKYKLLEAQKIIAQIKPDSFIITLEIEAKQFSSIDFAKKIEEISQQGKNETVFIIGGANGLHSSVCELSDLKLSFSKMTFTHQMMKILVLEQIYRAFKILKNEPYHR